jgi:glucan phosphoethanolaminetransferase (alkaline phosphatase superfamily)
MSSISYRKAIYLFFFVGIFITIFFPDAVFGLFLGIFHIILALAHIIFEFVEVNLDRLVEHIFETDVHQTQVIVFYLMLSIAFCGLYYLWNQLPCAYHKSKENLLAMWLEQKAIASLYWRDLSLINKIKLAVFSTTGIYCIVFFNL